MKKKKIKKNNPLSTVILILIITAFVICGIFSILYCIGKVDLAVYYSNKILNLYQNVTN